MSQLEVHYLLVFDHEAGRLIDEKLFKDADEAVVAYSEVEDRYQDRKRIEVVLIGSDSLETIKRTHANYFDGTATVSGLLAGI